MKDNAFVKNNVLNLDKVDECLANIEQQLAALKAENKRLRGAIEGIVWSGYGRSKAEIYELLSKALEGGKEE